MGNIRTLCKTAIVILIWNGCSALATVYDSDGSSINIQSIHDTLAQKGDTIALPIGTGRMIATLSVGIAYDSGGGQRKYDVTVNSLVDRDL